MPSSGICFVSLKVYHQNAGTRPLCLFLLPSLPVHRTLLFTRNDVSETLGEIFCVDQTPERRQLSLLLAGVPTTPKILSNAATCRDFAAPPSPVVYQISGGTCPLNVITYRP
jgi:hypothetical protein